MKKILAIVMARGGSKGLLNKNILPLGDYPVVEHTIKWIHKFKEKHKELDIDIVVSTDISFIKRICDKYEGVHYYKRNEKLAEDTTRAEAVLYDICKSRNQKYDYVTMLLANNPIRHNSLLKESINVLKKEKETNCVISFQKVEKYNPAWMTEATGHYLPEDWMEQSFRRQKLKQYMIHDGHTITFRYKYFTEFIEKNGLDYVGRMYEFLGNKIKPIIHDKIIVDIDTRPDYLYAKYLFAQKEK